MYKHFCIHRETYNVSNLRYTEYRKPVRIYFIPVDVAMLPTSFPFAISIIDLYPNIMKIKETALVLGCKAPRALPSVVRLLTLNYYCSSETITVFLLNIR